MNVSIQIHFIATDTKSKVLKQGYFPLKGNKPEQVAYNWWRQVKKEIPVAIELEKVIVDEEDITNLVVEIDKKGEL